MNLFAVAPNMARYSAFVLNRRISALIDYFFHHLRNFLEIVLNTTDIWKWSDGNIVSIRFKVKQNKLWTTIELTEERA